MFQLTPTLWKSRSANILRKSRPQDFKYRELTRWQRESQGLSRWDHAHSRRPRPVAHRFNPESLGLTKGTSAFAWKWWYTQQPFLPQVAPDGYRAPKPSGNRPDSWDEEFTDAILSLSDKEVREHALNELTKVIFEETQRDGYELRRLNYEGKPLTDLPEPRIIENFVFEEETLRERVIRRIVENVFRLTPTSSDRKELKTVSNILDFISAHVTSAREPSVFVVTDKVRQILSSYHLQPKLGFVHALPKDKRHAVLQEWERLHHLDWQFGKAVYTPTSTERKAGNMVWLREQREDEAREAFRAAVASGEAREAHLRRIAEAAQ
mmetsp:Transcript_55620/g.63855  ORF Transcript_55620/g.63855 Transcript_55620/m.63855 type:complete len:323 (-) Transcript_55620:60-1028(-)